MLKPPTNLPHPTPENLGQYKPSYRSLIVLTIGVASVLATVIPFKYVGGKWIIAAFGLSIFWSISIAMFMSECSLRKVLAVFQYRLNPSRYAQKTWAQQEAYRRAYLAEQQQLKTEAYWRGMSGFAFEANLCEVLKSHGIKAELTKKTGDGGVDIWVTSSKGPIAIQCKAYKKQVGPAAVRELYGVVHGSKAIMGILACTGGFTSGAIDFANSNKGIYLAGLNDVILMAKGDSKFLPYLR